LVLVMLKVFECVIYDNRVSKQGSQRINDFALSLSWISGSWVNDSMI